jgi:Sulfotransferase family
MNLPTPLLHVGYTKGGSTWLQKFLFQNADAGFAMVDRRRFVDIFMRPHPLDFDPSRIAAELQPLFEEASGPHLTTVVSEEGLSGDPHSGGWGAKELAERLYALFPESRVLIVIREQRDMIASTYKQYVRVGGACAPADCLQPPTHEYSIHWFDFDFFNYHRLIGLYHRLFGRDRVLVLAFEEFQRDPDTFATRLLRFVDLPPAEALPFDEMVKVALSPYAVAVKRRANLFGPPTSVNPRPLSIPFVHGALSAALHLQRFVPRRVDDRLDRRLERTIDALIGDRYVDSNRLTRELTGLDLGSLGYMS